MPYIVKTLIQNNHITGTTTLKLMFHPSHTIIKGTTVEKLVMLLMIKSADSHLKPSPGTGPLHESNYLTDNIITDLAQALMPLAGADGLLSCLSNIHPSSHVTQYHQLM